MMNNSSDLKTRLYADHLQSLFIRGVLATAFLALIVAAWSGIASLLNSASTDNWTLSPVFLPALVIFLVAAALPAIKPRDMERRLAQWMVGLNVQPVSTSGYLTPDESYDARQLIQRYRTMIRETGNFRPDTRLTYHPDPLYGWLDQTYREARREHWNDSFSAVVAIGLMTYGRLDVIETALDGLTDRSHPGELHEMARRCLFSLLPLPATLTHGPVVHREALLTWLQENQSKLYWDSANYRFTLPKVKELYSKVG